MAAISQIHVPEGLPVKMTVALAAGMAARVHPRWSSFTLPTNPTDVSLLDLDANMTGGGVTLNGNGHAAD
jgi:hypothetical protein